MTLTVPRNEPGILALLIGPDTREQLRIKAAIDRARYRHEAEAHRLTRLQLASTERDLREALKALGDLATHTATVIRPTTAQRRARMWLARPGTYTALIAAKYLERACT